MVTLGRIVEMVGIAVVFLSVVSLILVAVGE